MMMSSKFPPLYYCFDEKIEIAQVSNKILVKKKPSETKQSYENLILARFDNVKTDWHGDDICKLEFKEEDDKGNIIQTFLSDNDIVSVSSIYKTNDGLELGFTNEIVIKFKETVKDTERISILQKFGMESAKTAKTHEIYTVSKEKNIVEVANKLYETGLFDFVYPNIICKAELSHIPNDPYFQYQVTLHNTGQTFNGHTGTSDADIDAPEAWDITRGSNNIVIAVFDEGVTSNHPDLPNTRQVRLNGSNFGSGNVNDPSPTGNSNRVYVN
jgi:subtilisin family serine protease